MKKDVGMAKCFSKKYGNKGCQLSALYVIGNYGNFSLQLWPKHGVEAFLTEVLEAVLDDDSDDFGLSEDESSEEEDEGISAYAGQYYMNPVEVASSGRVVAQESDQVLIRFTWLTVKKRQNSFKASITKKSRDSLQNNKVDYSMG